MNGKTDTPSHHNELSRPFRFWLLVMTVVGLAVVFLTDFRTPNSYPDSREIGFHITLMPWIEATRITLMNGLDLFSGKPLSPPTDAQRASMLAGLLLALVIGPTLLLGGLRAYIRESRSKSVGYGSTFMLILGCVLSYSVAVSSVPLAITQFTTAQSIRKAQTLGEQRDHLIGSLSTIVRNAREYRTLPTALHGGNGSFVGFSIPTNMQKTELGIYSIESVLDTVLVLRARPVSSLGQSVVATLQRSGTLRFRFEEMGKN